MTAFSERRDSIHHSLQSGHGQLVVKASSMTKPPEAKAARGFVVFIGTP
jgi:hypothetical protein